MPNILERWEQHKRAGGSLTLDEFGKQKNRFWGLGLNKKQSRYANILIHELGQSDKTAIERTLIESSDELSTRKKLNQEVEAHRKAKQGQVPVVRPASLQKKRLQCAECGKNTQRVDRFTRVPVCMGCGKLPKFKTVTQGTAKEEYGLTASQLATLPVLEVPNPHYKSGPKMKLYRLSDVQCLDVELYKIERRPPIK